MGRAHLGGGGGQLTARRWGVRKWGGNRVPSVGAAPPRSTLATSIWPDHGENPPLRLDGRANRICTWVGGGRPDDA